MNNKKKKVNILISMNSFKGCLSALEANKIVNQAVFNYVDSIDCIPLVDGGTGSIEAWSHLLNRECIYTDTLNPLGVKISAPILIDGRSAYIEMAQASGIHLVDNNGDILTKNTYGTGLLIKKSLELGCKDIYIGLGGSATHDLGTGIMQALGVKFLDSQGNELKTPRELLCTERIDTSGLNPLAREANFTLLCDVNNVLIGELGAAKVFAPQKGATTEQLLLDCESLSRRFIKIYEQKHIEIGNKPGDGAAGGIPTLLGTMLNAEIQSGVDFTLSLVNLKSNIDEYDLIITGEGQFDEQSFYGKGPGTVVELARENNIPVVILAGGYKNIVTEYDNVSLFSIVPYPTTLHQAMTNAEEWLGRTARSVIKVFVGGVR